MSDRNTAAIVSMLSSIIVCMPGQNTFVVLGYSVVMIIWSIIYVLAVVAERRG